VAAYQPSRLASDRKLPYSRWVFGLSGGEWFIVAFVTVMVVSARYWPAFGERIALRSSGATPHTDEKPANGDTPRE
jgi:hypothetical protein